MTHYEQRLQQDLDDIHARFANVAARVEKAIEDALGTVLSGDEDLAYRTILNDERINRDVRELDRLCHKFVAVHLPSAGPLRRMSSVIRTNIQLERLGDYAVIICREAVQLTRPPDGGIARELEMMATDSRRTLHQAITAFVDENGEAARATMHLADRVEHTMDSVYDALLGAGSTEELRDRVALFVVFNMLKRVWDQAKNICEETVFAVYGEQKAARVHNILFVDRDNCGASLMAETIARRAHGERARFHSAGPEPAGRSGPPDGDVHGGARLRHVGRRAERARRRDRPPGSLLSHREPRRSGEVLRASDSVPHVRPDMGRGICRCAGRRGGRPAAIRGDLPQSGGSHR